MFERIKNFVSRAKTYWGVVSSHLTDLKLNWGEAEFLRANEMSLYLNRAIAKRAEKVGEIEFVLRDRKGDPIESDPLIDLLYKPNPMMTGAKFWGLYQKYKDLTGRAFIYLDLGDRNIFEPKSVKAMWLLRSDSVKIEHAADGSVTRYLYTRADGVTVPYTPAQIIHDYEPNPMNPMSSLALVKPGQFAVDTETQINQYHSKILRNGGRIEGVFKFKANLTKQQVSDAKQSYEEQFAGSSKVGKPLFLGGDAEYIRTGLTPEELSFLEAKKMTLEDICILTGVPKSLLSSYEGVKFDNADASQMIFLRDTIRPLLRGLTQLLDERLFPDDKFLDFVDPTPENVDQKLDVIKAASDVNALTVNEKRRLINDLIGENLDDVEGGDQVLVPLNLVPMNSEDTPAAPQPTKAAIIKAEEHPLRDPHTREKYGSLQVKRASRYTDAMKQGVKRYFLSQRKRIVDHLKDTKSAYRTKDAIDSAFNLTLETKKMRDSMVPFIREALLAAGKASMDLMGSDFEFNISSHIQSWLERKADVFARTINETTFGNLKDAFEESLAAGETRQQLIDRIEKLYDGYSVSRAETIARTEVHAAYQNGTIEGYRQAGATIKIWTWAPGVKGGVRDDHAALDGEERPLDVPFSNGLMYPGDPSGSAEDVINCGCTA